MTWRPITATGLLFGPLATIASAWYFQPGVPILVAPDDVVSVYLHPVPEGPAAYFSRLAEPERGRPISDIDDLIPIPLPAPLHQFPMCWVGGEVVIGLADGETISYGPCRLPARIQRFRDEIVRRLQELSSR
jgi:hypothetical protein